MLREILESINEGMTATITVKDGNLFKTSILQYDGYLTVAGKELLNYYNSKKDAKKLVTKSGKLRSIYPLEYYRDKSVSILEITKDEHTAVQNSNECYLHYYFDGTDWFYAEGNIHKFEDMKLLKDVTKLSNESSDESKKFNKNIKEINKLIDELIKKGDYKTLNSLAKDLGKALEIKK